MMNFDNLNLNACEEDQNQGDIINAILEKFPAPTVKGLRKRFKKDIEGGICYMLSMEWLRLIITGNDQWKQFGEITGEKDIIYYKQIAQNFCMYLDDAKNNLTDYLTNGASNNSKSVDEEFVKLCMAGAAEVTGERQVATAEEMAKAITEDKSEKYFSVRLIMKEGAHRVAAYREDKVTLYFYDPNRGIINVTAETEEELFIKVTRLMCNVWKVYYTGNSEIANGYVRFVKKNEVKKD